MLVVHKSSPPVCQLLMTLLCVSLLYACMSATDEFSSVSPSCMSAIDEFSSVSPSCMPVCQLLMSNCCVSFFVSSCYVVQGHTCLLIFMVAANTLLTVAQMGISLILNSLSLFIDSVDMALDVIGYSLNLLAEWYGQQPGKDQTSRLKLELCRSAIRCTHTHLHADVHTAYSMCTLRTRCAHCVLDVHAANRYAAHTCPLRTPDSNASAICF